MYNIIAEQIDFTLSKYERGSHQWFALLDFIRYNLKTGGAK